MSPEVRHFQPRPDIAPGMTERRLSTFRLLGLGLSNKQIARELKTTEGAVGIDLFRSIRDLGAAHKIHAILTLIDRGIFDLDEFVGEFDLRRFDFLKPHHHKVLQAMVKDNCSRSSNREIARDSDYTEKSVGQRMYEIHTTIEVFSRTRTAVLYLAYQRQQGQHTMSENGGVVFSPASTVPLTRRENRV